MKERRATPIGDGLDPDVRAAVAELKAAWRAALDSFAAQRQLRDAGRGSRLLCSPREGRPASIFLDPYACADLQAGDEVIVGLEDGGLVQIVPAPSAETAAWRDALPAECDCLFNSITPPPSPRSAATGKVTPFPNPCPPSVAAEQKTPWFVARLSPALQEKLLREGQCLVIAVDGPRQILYALVTDSEVETGET